MASWLTWQSKQVVLKVKRRSVHGKGFVMAIGEVPHAAGGRVVPGFLFNVIRNRQDLQAAFGHLREEVIGVLSAHHVGDRIVPCVFFFFFFFKNIFFVRRMADPALLHAISARKDCLPMTTSSFCGWSSFLAKAELYACMASPCREIGKMIVELCVAVVAGFRAGELFLAADGERAAAVGATADGSADVEPRAVLSATGRDLGDCSPQPESAIGKRHNAASGSRSSGLERDCSHMCK